MVAMSTSAGSASVFSGPAQSGERLAGKVAVVTGASRGIGRAISLALAREGAFVVAASRSRARLDGLVEEIRSSGGSAIACPCDVGDREQGIRMVTEAAAPRGRLDILVNNAQGFGTADAPAQGPVVRPLEELDEDEWEYAFRTGRQPPCGR
jgi:NAD(P)-dependent dehydrogenase (short-subunit alcohol dehydrogenase family)